ncbi:hypothetical protein BT96DRAFT_1086763 [Gymnopus androsaceus JB14]|uniref:Protein argonaute Mid domain-containing protein n=1 Tax=Gymnopus androsaceus JB14 TaxID=1447944 RepID=A0A6A4GKY6_9AGAR|nr:hypothetical protein BT96DRAFT_1086763 [Gymnopus androsaceus JB14]
MTTWSCLVGLLYYMTSRLQLFLPEERSVAAWEEAKRVSPISTFMGFSFLHVTKACGITITQLDSIEPTLVVYQAEATFVGVGLWDMYGAVVSPGTRKYWGKQHDMVLLENVNELMELWHLKMDETCHNQDGLQISNYHLQLSESSMALEAINSLLHTPANGAWNMHEKQFFKPVETPQWAFIVYIHEHQQRFNGQNAADMIKGLCESTRQVGINMGPTSVILWQNSQGDIEAQLCAAG